MRGTRTDTGQAPQLASALTWGRFGGYGMAHIRQDDADGWAVGGRMRECLGCRNRWTPRRTCRHCGSETVG